MRAPRAKSTRNCRTAAIHAKGPGADATPNKSEFIAVESASNTTPHRRPPPVAVGWTQRKKAPLLRSAPNGTNGKPEERRRRRRRQEETPFPGAAQSAVHPNDGGTCVEAREGGETARPLAIIFARAPSPYKSDPFRLAVALKVKYANKFADAIVTSRPRGCKYQLGITLSGRRMPYWK